MSHSYPCDTCGEERGAGYPHECDMAEVIDGLRSRISELESAPRFAILYEASYLCWDKALDMHFREVVGCYPSVADAEAAVGSVVDKYGRRIDGSTVKPGLALHVEGDTYSIVTLGRTVTLTPDGSTG